MSCRDKILLLVDGNVMCHRKQSARVEIVRTKIGFILWQ